MASAGFSRGVGGQSIAAALAADQGQSPHYVPRPWGTAQEAAEKRYSGPRKGGAEKPALSERATTLFPQL